jgi:hypothetical protein
MPPSVKTPPEYTGGNFYQTVKSQLDDLFANYPREEYLCGLFEGTEWVRVNYDNAGQYYTVGLIYDGDTVRCICYGVPGRYAPRPPAELTGFCQWLPFSTDEPQGGGYWLMYQDAETGKSITDQT